MVVIWHEEDEEEQQQQQQQQLNKQVLPEDIICEILARVPLLSLATQCRLVCEEWEKYLHQPYFQELHSRRVTPISGFFVQTQRRGCDFYKSFVSNYPRSIASSTTTSSSTTDSTLDSIRLSEKMKIVASSPSGGMLCCIDYSKTPSRYCVCRPGKGECYKAIANPKTRYSDHKVIIFPTQFNPLGYTILRFSGLGYALHCEVYDSHKRAWKQFQDVKLPDDDFLDPSEQPGVIVNGFLHCLTSNGMMFVFNLEVGSWRTIRLPIQQNIEQSGIAKKLVKYKGSIAVMLLDDNCMEIWIFTMEKQEDEQDYMSIWRMEYRVDLPDDLCNFSLLDLNSDKDLVVLVNHFGSMAWYDLKNSSYTREKMGCSAIGSTFHAFQADINSCL